MASNKQADYQPVSAQAGSSGQGANLFQRLLQDNPLALGLVFFALGAIIGLLLPETQKENELMGEKRDQLLDRGREVVEDLRHRAGAVVETAQTAAQEALDSVKDEAREAVTAAVDTIKDSAQQQGFVPGAK
jgi:hypothetical protein